MSKFRATFLHFCISLLISCVVILVMTMVWFPPPLFEVLGGYGLLLLIASIDIVLGPLLTCIVFKSGKKGMKFDLAFIATCQTIALCYGVYTVAAVRPVYTVFVRDRFELVRSIDLTEQNLAAAVDQEYRTLPWLGPKIIGVIFPINAQERTELMMSSLKGGADIQILPKYYADIKLSKAEMMNKVKPLAALKVLNPSQVDAIDRLPQKTGIDEKYLGFIVYRAIREDIAMVLDTRDAHIIDAYRFKPW
jgi:hypothetical protein